MHLSVFVLVLLVAQQVSNSGGQDSSEAFQRERRIIGGKDAPADKFPWAVTIRGNTPGSSSSLHVCGATIVSNRWLVTAAHCFWSASDKDVMDLRDPKLWHIIAGQVFVAIESYISQLKNEKPPKTKPQPKTPEIDYENLDNEELQSQLLSRYRAFENRFNILYQKLKQLGFDRRRRSPAANNQQETISAKDLANHYHVEKIIIHPNYKPKEIEFDIALIRLDRDLPLNVLPGINAIGLPPAGNSALYPKPGDACVIVGWGCQKGNGDPTTRAQYAVLQVVDHLNCNRVYRNKAGLNKNHEFCAGYVKRGVGICPGDSGGGLVCKSPDNNWYLAGATSATHSVRPGDYPGLFTRVAFFTDWIKASMKAR